MMPTRSGNDCGDMPLSQYMELMLRRYFEQLDGQMPSELYDIIFKRVEEPLLRCTLEYVGGNQSRAAAVLGINRNTLRRKMTEYGL